MSLQDGMAAINLEMPKRVPRTEYSAQMHWELMNKVTGSNVDSNSPQDEKRQAEKIFYRQWNYDFVWRILIYNDEFGNMRTKMGHAEYAAQGSDYDNKIKCPFKTPQEALAFDPVEAYGIRNQNEIMERFEKDYQEACDLAPDAVNMTGIYISCISGLIEIFGWDMLLTALGTDPVQMGKVTNRYTQWVMQYFEALAQTNVPVVMVHDDIVWTCGAFTKPDWYREFVFPNYKILFEPLLQAGKKIMFTSDGNYTQFIDDIAETRIHGFVLEPVTDMEYIAQKYGKTHVFIGNADTRILLNGTKEQIRAEVQRCMAIGKNCPGFFMAVGNHIPPNTPVENALYYNEAYEELSQR